MIQNCLPADLKHWLIIEFLNSTFFTPDFEAVVQKQSETTVFFCFVTSIINFSDSSWSDMLTLTGFLGIDS